MKYSRLLVHISCTVCHVCCQPEVHHTICTGCCGQWSWDEWSLGRVLDEIELPLWQARGKKYNVKCTHGGKWCFATSFCFSRLLLCRVFTVHNTHETTISIAKKRNLNFCFCLNWTEVVFLELMNASRETPWAVTLSSTTNTPAEYFGFLVPHFF